jgi:metal-sulfur cluster biosynthetic enzyme
VGILQEIQQNIFKLMGTALSESYLTKMTQTECVLCVHVTLYVEYAVSEVSTATKFAHQVTWSVQKKLARMKQRDTEGAD